MKILLIFILSLVSICAFSQSTLPLRADTVVIEKINGSATLKIKNSTRDTLGVLSNIGGGATAFLKPKKYNDTCLIIGRDTICGVGGGIDSIRQVMDSVIAYKNGSQAFQFKNKNTDTADWYNAKDWGMIGDGVTDNSTALQDLIDYIGARSRSSIIYFPDTVYIFSGPLQDGARRNSIILFPSVAITEKQYTIMLRGKRNSTYSPSAFVSSVPFPDATIFRCTNNTPSGVEPSFLGGKGPISGDYGETSYMVPGLEDITIQMVENPRLTAVNFRGFTNTRMRGEVNIVAGTSQSVLDKAEPTDSTVYGYIQPDLSHGINQLVEGTLNISGFYYGLRLGEGAVIHNYGSYGNKIALATDGADGTMNIYRMIVGWNKFSFRTRNSSLWTGLGPTTLLVHSYNCERWIPPGSGSSSWYDFVADVYDPDNMLRAEINSKTVIAGSGGIGFECLFAKIGGDQVHQHCQGFGSLPFSDTLSSNTFVTNIDITNTSSGSSAAIQNALRNNLGLSYSMGITGSNYSGLPSLLGDQVFHYSSASNGMRFIADNATGSFSWLAGSGTTVTQMFLSPLGRLGLGTTSPSEIFHAVINSNIAGSLRFDNLNAGSSANAGIRLQSDAGDAYLYRTSTAYGSGLGNSFVMQSTGSADMVMYGGGEIARFKYGGNVLIGTTTDESVKLLVNGKVRIKSMDSTATPVGGLVYRDSDGELKLTSASAVGTNLATANQTATGNRTHNFDHKTLFIDSMSQFRFSSIETDNGITSRKSRMELNATRGAFSNFNIGGPFFIFSLRRANIASDSIINTYGFQTGGISISSFESTATDSKTSSIYMDTKDSLSMILSTTATAGSNGSLLALDKRNIYIHPYDTLFLSTNPIKYSSLSDTMLTITPATSKASQKPSVRLTKTRLATTFMKADSLSSVSSVEIDFSAFAGYDRVVIYIDKVDVSNNGVALNARFSSNGGSSFASGASDYEWLVNWRITTPSDGVNADASDDHVTLAQDISNVSGHSAAGEIELLHPFDPSYQPLYKGEFIVNFTTTGAIIRSDCGGRQVSGVLLNAIQFYPSAGTFDKFKYRVVGYKN